MARFNSRHLVFAAAAAILLLFLPSAAPDIISDRAALQALRSSVGGRPLLWNLSSPTPCSWAGVTCSPGNAAVVALRLPGMGLSGHLPPNTISNLTNLQTLSLRYNALSGPLPADFFSSLTSLRNLYLQNNLFSGQIPDSLFSLSSLVRLNLGHNNFSGPISPSFSNLTRLGTLYLEDNHFSGSIPEMKLPLVQLNVSNNNLTGPIPRSLSGNPRNSFAGNSLCGGPLESCGNAKHGNSLSGGAIAGIVIGSVIGFLLIVLLITCLFKRLREKSDGTGAKEKELEAPAGRDESGSRSTASMAGKENDKGEANVISGGKKDLVFMGNTGWRFDLEDLLRASAEVLGKGAFGTTYKAVLEMELAVVVKRLRDIAMGEKEFKEKMEDIGRLDHENLVPLRAYYYNKEEKLLVYDYLPMGSLSALLHGNTGVGRTPLNWETRASIALGAARGISHIHSQGPSFSHGSIKSSNILLTNSYEARVSDSGLAHLSGPFASPNRIAGYRAPEVTEPNKISQKADVYSFGVLMLELLTGKAPTHSLVNEEGVDLPRWVQSVVREEWTTEVFDLELLRYQNVNDDMLQMLQLAVDCTAQHPDNRPSMDEVSGKIGEVCRWSSGDESGDIVGVDLGLSPI
ncbi:hypothetical protein CASFOL_023402 [Castilleja foliolosa]|uniref:Protein kinase domain-containing protein n=1 Tax=Castilleja foliolosa TaxID=1961234 RepID=A0ABD3CKH4_9LAMI